MALELSANVSAVLDQVTQAALQSGQQVHSLAMQNAVHFQQLAQTASLQLLMGGLQVGQAYQGAHLKKGSEIDAQESIAEGAAYKGESIASMPQAALQDVLAAAIAQALAKITQSTPPETAKA